jgi:predicted transposase YdaD
MLGLTDRDLKQTRFYQEVFAEGQQQGRQEGQQEGRQEGEMTLILRLLQRRCGVLAPEVEERITRLGLERLEALGEALLDFTGPADLERWLREQA